MTDLLALAATTIPRATCPTCHGKGYWQSRRGGERWPCGWCAAPTEAQVDLALAKLTPEQWAFLRFGQHTLADQPMTPEEWDAHLCGFYVEGDDEIDLGDGLTWPATKVWFASSSAHYKGDGGPWELSFKYNALGLTLRARTAGTGLVPLPPIGAIMTNPSTGAGVTGFDPSGGARP